MKERYYAIAGKLSQIRSPKTGGEEKVYVYDADHERRRKEQLRRLWDRTPEAIEEEQVRSRSVAVQPFFRTRRWCCLSTKFLGSFTVQSLIAEMRKIEQRKKDREKRAGDLQKLLSKAADVSGSSGSGAASMRIGASSMGVNKAANNVAGRDSPSGATTPDARRGPDGKKVGLFCFRTSGRNVVIRRNLVS